jgi:hypothetical protein
LDQPFSTLEHLVLSHIAAVSGCICVLLAWDETRRGFIRKLQALGLPVWVFVVVPPGQRQSLEAGPLSDEPKRFSVLEVGQVEAGLAQLK